MGYKKLDEVMELLSDELDGFEKAVGRLERLIQNVDKIEIKPDTAEIERLLQEHLTSEKDKNRRIQESIQGMGEQISKVRLIPKVQLWFQYSIWFISLVIIGYLAFEVTRIDKIQEKAFAEGELQIMSNLRGYFDQNPAHYQLYQKWLKEKDSIPNLK